jgi:uncharacterized protein
VEGGLTVELMLTGTRDQALLSLVVTEARIAADEAGGYVGRTAIQKILYFLNTRGVPMGYSFDIYHYGPYCEDVLRDAEWLQADEVIRDDSSKPQKYSNYGPGPALEQLLSAYAEELEPYRDRVRQVVRALVPLRAEHLELIATLDYLYRWLCASGQGGPWKERVVARFLEVKKDRFPRAEVEATYERMVSAGLVGA